MAVPFSNTKLRVPRGFQNLVEGLAREVLRSQPEELYAFGAQYFENLLKQREEGGVDPAEHGAKMEDRFYNNKAFTQPEIDPSDPQQQDAALAIQTKFRQHAAKQEVEVLREEKAATTIQAGYRGYQGRQQVDEIRTGDEPQNGEEEVDIDLNDPDVEAAAVKIQAGFKGFKVRQESQRQKSAKAEEERAKKDDQRIHQQQIPTAPTPGSPAPEEEVDIDLTDPEVEAAAVKIQAGFKGFKARKEIIEKQQNAQQVPAPSQKTQEEEIDIDLNDPEVEQAAVKIQAGFKGMKARQEVKSKRDLATAQAEQPTKESIPVSDPKTEPNDDEVDIDLHDPEVEQAAIKIQAGFKGFKTRKEMQNKLQETPSEQTALTESANEAPAPEGLIDIDLNDPEVEQAAIKIQAGFKGLKTRKEFQAKKEAEVKTTEQVETVKQEEIDINLDDPEVEQAAVKIQAGFKGMKARREVQAKREDTTEPKQPAAEEEEIDIDLNDPEVEKAALKIQAGFKGFKGRKAQGPKKSANAEPVEEKPVEVEAPDDSAEGKGEEEVDIDLEDPEVQAAAVKIQAGFKGMQARKSIASRSAGKKPETAAEVTTEESSLPAEPEAAKEETAPEADIELNTTTETDGAQTTETDTAPAAETADADKEAASEEKTATEEPVAALTESAVPEDAVKTVESALDESAAPEAEGELAETPAEE